MPIPAMLAQVHARPAALEAIDGLGDWAARYGYLAVLLIVAADGVMPLFPGETAIVSAAVLAAAGSLSLAGVVAAGAVGAAVGDSGAYWIGRAGGEHIRRAVARLAGRQRVEASERMVQRQGPALVVVGRFLPGLRLGVNMSCGAGHMDYRRFVAFNALGAALWSMQAALLGYFAGRAFAGQTWLALVVALGVAGVVACIVAWRERARVRRERPPA